MKPNIVRELKKYLPFLLQAKKDNLNEADTSQRVFKVFEDVLGYNPMTDIAKEMRQRCKYIDLTVKIEGAIKFLVEVKPAASTIKAKYVDQGELYASEGNIQWVLLTNGVDWNLYHLTFGKGVQYECAFAVTLSEETIGQCAEMIGLLHRSSIKSGEHNEFWRKLTALSPESIGRALFTEPALRFIRRDIRRREKILIGMDDLAEAIHAMFTQEARERIGPPKIRIKKTGQIKPTISASCSTPPLAAPGAIQPTVAPRTNEMAT